VNGRLAFALSIATTAAAGHIAVDPFAWLADVRSEPALTWVANQNDRTKAELGRFPLFAQLQGKARVVEREHAQLAFVEVRDGKIYGVVQGAATSFGRWSVASLAKYLRGRPNWTALLDADNFDPSIGAAPTTIIGCESYSGTRCMLRMQVGHSYAYARREFDLALRKFVADGFALAGSVPGEATAYVDPDNLLAATDLGQGMRSDLGTAGVLVRWRRGTPVEAAEPLLHVPSGYAFGALTPLPTSGVRPMIIVEAYAGDNSRRWWLYKHGRIARMRAPSTAFIAGYAANHVIFLLREGDANFGRKHLPQFSLLAIPFGDLTAPLPRVASLPLAPSEVPYVAAAVKNGLLVITYDCARARLWRYQLTKGVWTRTQVMLPDNGQISFLASDPHRSRAYVRFESFLVPPTYYEIDTVKAKASAAWYSRQVFDARGLQTRQWEAVSKDGTRVPYFIVSRRDAKRPGPTLMWGYGSHGQIEPPRYDAALGKLWLERGGTYVFANIRGGGELGPKWAVRGVDRQKTYEDFIAVGEDLARRGITSSRHLGIQGHSNGGTLVGAVLNMRPDLFNAAIIENPALDQLRILAQPAGESDWARPDRPEEMAFVEATSPYQNMKPRIGFPSPLVMTSVDDGPAFVASPRMYVAKLQDLGVRAYYYEFGAGGHGLGITPEDRALANALRYSYLWTRLN
jgi:prolyl oligopeptidase